MYNGGRNSFGIPLNSMGAANIGHPLHLFIKTPQEFCPSLFIVHCSLLIITIIAKEDSHVP